MNNTNLHHLLLEELADIYDAEQQIIKSLPLMIEAATDADLSSSLADHLEATEGQVRRLEEAAQTLGVTLTTKSCSGMAGILKEGEKMLSKEADSSVKDVMITLAAMRVEHYEMAVYTGLVTLANTLGYDEVESLLQETLDEESDAADTLQAAAEGGLFSSGLVDEAADTDE